MAIEIVDFPMKNGDFPWQHVSSPEGKPAQSSFEWRRHSRVRAWAWSCCHPVAASQKLCQSRGTGGIFVFRNGLFFGMFIYLLPI